MLITRRNPFHGREVTREINVTPDQLDVWERWGLPVSVAFPHLSEGDQRFIKTGITPEQWAKIKEDVPNLRAEEPEENDLDARFDPTHAAWGETA